jgi:hypothetical protein
VPYGGIELARLYDADGDPISGTGGRAPSAFGVLVSRLKGGHRVLASETGLHSDPKKPAVILTRSPRGRVTRQRKLASHPDAGPFSALDSRGSIANAGARVTTEHRFRRNSITAHWTITRSGGSGTDRARVLFPTSGRTGVVIEATLRGGRQVTLTDGGARPRLSDVREFLLRSAYGSYTVQLLGRPVGTTQVMHRVWQRANPRGGPTLALELPNMGTKSRRELSVRIIPHSSGGVGHTESEPPPATAPPATPTPVPATPAPGA